jgi:hypothetical protein
MTMACYSYNYFFFLEFSFVCYVLLIIQCIGYCTCCLPTV